MQGSQKISYQVSITWFYRKATLKKKTYGSLFQWYNIFKNW